MKTRPSSSKRNLTPPSPNPAFAAEWAWHYRTLRALRDYLRGQVGDREREPHEAMEPPSLHAEDFAADLYDRELARALPGNASAALAEVEAALARIKAGIYGRCEKTGRPIPKEQLQARPWRRVSDGSA